METAKNMKNNFTIRIPEEADIEKIIDLFVAEVEAGRMLARDPEKMKHELDDWRVAVDGDLIVGCVSLVFFNPTICEVRSLAVAETHRSNGLGKKLVESALDLAKERQADQVLTLTRAAHLFENLGFVVDDINNFPKKVAKDCQNCPFIDCCDEIALLYTF